MMQDDIFQITIFAEQEFCKTCVTNPCEIFTSGNYEQCPKLVSAYEKATTEYHTFMNSVQKQHIPGIRKRMAGYDP